MQKHRLRISVFFGLICGALVALSVFLYTYPTESVAVQSTRVIKTTHAASLASEFGINGAVSSLSSDSAKQSAVNKITGASFGWVRQEFTYADSIDFTPYDSANNKMKAAGLKQLGLLSYPGSGKSHDQWKSYVSAVVNRYNDVAAWEIMNEIDNTLSASDYVTYLQEAHDIIKSINSAALVICSGLTSRQEATNYWDGIKAAGGWGYFDNIGLHVYHSGNPEKVNFGGGDLVGELDRVAGNINKNGGGKKIWITEMGYASGSVGEDHQADWLARSFVMLRSVSKLERMFIYHLYDGSGDSYGLLNSDLSEKQAYGTVKDVINNLSGLGIGSKLTPQQKTTLDAFDSVSGWSTQATSNGTASLSADSSGYKGSAMKISYSFNADSAYAVAEKSIIISGTPTALGVWIYGDDTKNVWKFRFTDNNNETFQADLGSIAAGWSYKQFSIGTDTAFTSWGGNGNIDFPISFNSIVIDRQGGSASAEGKVDELIAITGSADLYAYEFGSTAAYWKASGSDSAVLCGATRTFTESVQFATGVNCSDTPTASATSSSTNSTSSTSTTTTTKKKAPVTTTVTKVVVDKSKSSIRVDGTDIPADGTSAYKIVVALRDSNNKPITNQKPTITISGGDNWLKDAILVGDEWFADVTSTVPGERTATAKVGDLEIGSAKMTFVAVKQAAAPVSTIKDRINLDQVGAVSTEPVPVNYPLAVGIAGGVLLIAAAVAWKFKLLTRLQHHS